jgi:hypothetical protein
MVAELREAHPDWTLAEIAAEVGITRQRVRQLLVAQGLPTTATPRRYGERQGGTATRAFAETLLAWVRSRFASSMDDIWCVRCHARRTSKRVEVVQVGYSQRMIGECQACGAATSTFVSR